MKLKLASIVALAALSLVGYARPNDTPLPAVNVLHSAEASAAKEHKNVLLIFHASWCGWCHKLDAFLEDPKMGKIMNANYEIIHVDVQERGDKKSLENPGGNEMMEQMGGKDAGLPYFLILSPKNDVLATSIKPNVKGNGNIGYPSAPDEITHFMGMLDKSAEHLNAADRAKLQAYLEAHGQH